MAASAELGPELSIVVNLPVHHYRYGSVLVKYRLIATDYVYDRESLHTEANSIVAPDAP